RFERRRLVRDVLATGPFAQWARRPVVDGTLLVGDAADFFDPFTGQGIYSALRGAELAADCLVRALEREVLTEAHERGVVTLGPRGSFGRRHRQLRPGAPRARCQIPGEAPLVTKHGVDPAQFRQLLGRFATGVTVVTTRDPRGRPIGMTASSVASVSLDPPLLLVCVDRQHDMHPAMQAAPRFVLNVLAADQEALSRRFAAEHPDR